MSMHSVRIPDSLDDEINQLIGPTRSKSELIRDALTQYVRREQFKRLRGQVLPFAEAAGLLTDDDVFEFLS